MPNLIIIDETERQRIREALKSYKRLHGKIGDPALQERMKMILGVREEQLSLSTLQRFLRGKGRTDDFMVRRYQKFLELVAPLSFADDLGKTLGNVMVYPVNFRPDVAPFEGRYEMTVRASGADGAKEADEPARGLILTPTQNPQFLKSIFYIARAPERGAGGEPAYEYTGSGAFVPCGIAQFLLASARFANASFALLTQTESDPVVLQGTMIATAYPGEPPKSGYEMSLKMVHGVRTSAGDTASKT